MKTQKEIETLAQVITDCAQQIHRDLGPGLVATTYKKCLANALQKQGLAVECDRPQPIIYQGIKIDAGYHLDMIVENQIVLINLSVDRILTSHETQLFTLIKLSNCPLGMIINWNTTHIKQGIKRVAL